MELDKQFLQECDSYNKIQGFHSFYNIYTSYVKFDIYI